MAFKLIVALALLAVCTANPIEEGRAKRSYTVAQGYSSQYGKNAARAEVHGQNANAEASNDDTHLARDGLGSPGQVYVKTYNGASEPAQFDYAQPAYYPVPAPATVVTYQKYADVPAELPAQIPSQIVYEAPAPAAAQSSATTNGGYGSVNANANTAHGTAASNAAAEGTGQSTVSSNAQSSGLSEPAVVAAKQHGYYSTYTPYSPVNAASANANTYGHQSTANAAAKSGAVPQRKSISWRFGTAYDQPAAYGAAKAAANYGYIAPASHGLRSSANTAGFSVAQATADNNAVKSAASSNGGFADANAVNNGGNYAVLRSDNLYAGYNNGISSTSTTHNDGAAASQAQINSLGHEIVHSAAKSGISGSAQSTATSNGPAAPGLRSTGAWGGRTVSTAYSKGEGHAASSANNQGLATGYRVVNTHANSSPYGSAGSNAFSL